MAISPPSDIVLDVAQAVAPQDLQAARAELARMAQSRAVPSAESFAAEVRAPAPRVADAKPARPPAYVKFESMVLGSFMDAMMPKNADAVYGGGMAGGIWKSFLAQQLGEVMAERGGIGIADRLLGDHYKAGDTVVPLSGARANPGLDGAALQRDLSSALLDQFDRNMVASIGGPGPRSGADDKEG